MVFPRAGTHPTDGSRNQQREREQESAAECGSVLGGIDDGDGERWPRDWEGRRRAGKELGEVAKRGKDCCLLFLLLRLWAPCFCLWEGLLNFFVVRVKHEKCSVKIV